MFVRVLSQTNSEWQRSKSERNARHNRPVSCHTSSPRRNPSASPRKRQLKMSASDIIKQRQDGDERRALNPSPMVRDANEIKEIPCALRLDVPPKRMPGETRLTVEVPEGPEERLHSSTSMTSLNIRMRKKIHRIRHNQCIGVVVLLTMGALFNGLAYMASVWSAELNAEVIEAAVAKHEQSLNYKIKRVVSGSPSKYLIGLLNFVGRMFSAVGTLMLVQVVVTFCQRRRGRCLKAGASNADDLLTDQIGGEGGFSEAIGECFMGCASF